MKLTNDVYAIVSLNTGLGVYEETGLLSVTPLKVLIRYYKGERSPSYLLDDVSEALEIAYEYNQKSIVILMGNDAMIVDVLTGAITLKGSWINVGSVEPDTDEWTFDQTTNSYYAIDPQLNRGTNHGQ